MALLNQLLLVHFLSLFIVLQVIVSATPVKAVSPGDPGNLFDFHFSSDTRIHTAISNDLLATFS